ncbi:hypothetical protein RsTz2092_02470 [Deferribacterales bacterium RsTz2092]|nr:hypothetical protein AGMMS49941_11480 [Deferribacterales bacterium]
MNDVDKNELAEFREYQEWKRTRADASARGVYVAKAVQNNEYNSYGSNRGYKDVSDGIIDAIGTLILYGIVAFIVIIFIGCGLIRCAI